MPDETHLRVFIEDDPRLGPWFCPATALPSTADPAPFIEGLHRVSADQVGRWQTALEAWEQAQQEMRQHVAQRRREMLANIGRYSGVEAAQRAEAHLGNRSARQ